MDETDYADLYGTGKIAVCNSAYLHYEEYLKYKNPLRLEYAQQIHEQYQSRPISELERVIADTISTNKVKKEIGEYLDQILNG